ncbi:MAG: molybdopterin-dependent oxidoreductase [Desulfobacterota bacterium]|nr:molybdopterin-dependent oxidoreductase [Thermodesulfobacteriota bacterium]
MVHHNGSERTVITSCPHDCGGRCVLKVHVTNGMITRITTDEGKEPQLRACARGRAYRQRVYAPDRLRYPMLRTGSRGDGVFTRISWDEALDRVADALKRTATTYGPESILYVAYSGNTGTFLHNQLSVFRLLSMLGGFTPVWGSASFWGSLFSSEVTYGTVTAGHTSDDILNARFIIMWGWNPAETVQRTTTAWYLAQARERGVRIVSVDPRYTDSAATFAAQWIPIRPATDTAMLVAMAHVMITEQLHDQAFLDRHTVGFDVFQKYVLGETDGIPKTPAWAEHICGVPAQTIAALARDYATVKPAKLLTLGAPGRTAFGEQFHRAAATLAAMTGNIGIYGGEPAGFGLPAVGLQPLAGTGLISRKLTGNLPDGARQRPALHITKIWDALLKGKEGGYAADFKMVYITNSNCVNQFMNTTKAVRALQIPETIVVHEQFMTPTARFADILLPINTHLERYDIIRPWQGGPYYIYMDKAIEPLYESRSDLAICQALARRLGIEGYGDFTEEQWLRMFWQEAENFTDTKPLPDYDTLKREGVHKIPLDAPVIAFAEQRENPEAHPYPTPSGKIEIYSKKLADRNDPLLPPIPMYIEPWEGPHDPRTGKYPLQLISTHSKRRIHSNMHNLPWLRELEPHTVWINPADAAPRGILHGDTVKVFNDRGAILITAKVTERIMPSVVSIDQGAWYDPGPDGVDRGGCVNVLLEDRCSPAGAFCSNSCLVQIEKHYVYGTDG